MSDLLRRVFQSRRQVLAREQVAKRRGSSLFPSQPAAESSKPNTNTAVGSSFPATTANTQHTESGDLQQLQARRQLKGMAGGKSWEAWENDSKRALYQRFSFRCNKARIEKYKDVAKMLRLMDNPVEGWRTVTDYRKWDGTKHCIAYRMSRQRSTPRLQYGRLGRRLSKQAAKEMLDQKFEALVTQAYWIQLVADGDEWDLPAQRDEIIEQTAFRQEVAEEEARQEVIYQEVVRGSVPI